MALTPVRPSVSTWPATSSPDPISMLPTASKRASPLDITTPQRGLKRRKLSPMSDASTRTTPSMLAAEQGADGADAPSDLSDTPTTPMPVTRPAKFYVSEASAPVPKDQLSKLPDAVLLLMIPQLVLEPPSSPNYVSALYVSWLAVSRCSRLTLTAELEVRALTGLAEVGLLVLDAELEEQWVKGVLGQAEKGIERGLVIAKAHPTLSHYVSPLLYLQVRLAAYGPVRRALNLSKAACAHHSKLKSDATWLHYLHHSHILSSLTPSQVSTQLGHLANPPSVDPVFTRIHSLLRLSHLLPDQPDDFPDDCHSLLASFPDVSTLRGPDASLLLIAQILSFLHYASSRASKDYCQSQASLLDSLPALLDHILCAAAPSIPTSPRNIPILISCPPKKLLLALACLVAAVASRDASGRQSKRGIWASEGLKLFEEEMDELPRWYSLKEKKMVERQLHEIKALLQCEMISVAIMRSEFEEAKRYLDDVINYTCSVTMDLFIQFSPLISLLHGRLAHSVFCVERALDCYAMAHHFATEQGNDGIRRAVSLDLLGLKLGLGEDVELACEELLLDLADCKDEPLNEAAMVFRAIVAKEIHKSKQHLKRALDTTTWRSDNYLRLFVLCITASHYQLTFPERAMTSLKSSRQICLGLGARPEGEQRSSYTEGNSSIGLWVGEKYLELLQRQPEGTENKLKKQETINKALRLRWTGIQSRMAGLLGGQEETSA
ncbi:hypothetical protein DACRYDRAFT_115607 [Dacryopinax primogenitus]|uniref:Uncharacterized protein n=1 Tax=Dacryopinax primogenitus (strain DJM 731) TaxID=1858805 RepID=M5G1E7_DACPD|nr:uncharacterized protein DACRYDRAFT_115607 [Dacryopinax primogenitus]EJU02554.1 hypothetical protein DACRYDRAFT_115607 [Dacryopinax primogenitus]